MRTFEDYSTRAPLRGAHIRAVLTRIHRSPFDHKQILFLRPLGMIDFVQAHSRRTVTVRATHNPRWLKNASMAASTVTSAPNPNARLARVRCTRPLRAGRAGR